MRVINTKLKSVKKYITLNNKGMTLIEIIIALALLSILFAGFISVFIQAAVLNRKSSEMIDWTAIAQECIEDVYFLSADEATEKFDDTMNALENVPYSYTKDPAILDPNYVYEKIDSLTGARIRITITKNFDIRRDKVVVRVFSDDYSTEEIKMETLLSWKRGTP